MKKIGITTTVPSEVLLAAGYQPVDLNNLFISAANPDYLVRIAEKAGFPLNCCAWIKGIFGACIEFGIRDVICVTNGDCSNTVMLMEVLRIKGFNVIPFSYPEQPVAQRMQFVLQSFAERLGTSLGAAEAVREELQSCRHSALSLDKLTWRYNRVSGWENHLWLVSSSDFDGDRRRYQRQLQGLLDSSLHRNPYPRDELRLGYIGVPPVYARGLHNYIEGHGARVVFNEIQRQFAMPEPGNSLAEQYSSYTYPYSIHERLRDIRKEVKKRNIDGIIHYVQAFCHRAIADIIFREFIDVPILTLEGNDEFCLSAQNRTRIEAFLDMLGRRRMGIRCRSYLDNVTAKQGGENDHQNRN